MSEKKPIPICQSCGKPLKRNTAFEHMKERGYKNYSEYGYNGKPVFCTLRCGYNFGYSLAKEMLRRQYSENRPTHEPIKKGKP